MEEVVVAEQRGERLVASSLRAFWKAAAALAEPEPHRDEVDAAAAGAEALLELASNDAELALRTILCPDPDLDLSDEVTWTVSCFEVGNIAPAELREFNNASDALAGLTGCEHESHVASELICSGGSGIQWVAAVHSDLRFMFQFPDLGNLSAPDPARAAIAVDGWRRHALSMNRRFAEACFEERDVIDLTATEQTEDPGSLAGWVGSKRHTLSVVGPATDPEPRSTEAELTGVGKTVTRIGLNRALEDSRSLLRRVGSLATTVSARAASDRVLADRQEQIQQRIDAQSDEIAQLAQEVAELRASLGHATELVRQLQSHTG